VVDRRELARSASERFADHLMLALISVNVAAVAVVLWAAISPN
jgi:hypothetical protein